MGRSRSVPANIEVPYIRSYGLTASLYSNIRFFKEPYIRSYRFCGHFVKLFEAHIRYYMVEVAHIFEFTGCKIEFTSSSYSILDGSMVLIFEVTGLSCHQISNIDFWQIVYSIFYDHRDRNFEYTGT